MGRHAASSVAAAAAGAHTSHQPPLPALLTCTLTATSEPSCSLALCTWASEAAAVARVSNSANSCSAGAPSSCCSTRLASEKGRGGTLSCSASNILQQGNDKPRLGVGGTGRCWRLKKGGGAPCFAALLISCSKAKPSPGGWGQETGGGSQLQQARWVLEQGAANAPATSSQASAGCSPSRQVVNHATSWAVNCSPAVWDWHGIERHRQLSRLNVQPAAGLAGEQQLGCRYLVELFSSLLVGSALQAPGVYCSQGLVLQCTRDR